MSATNTNALNDNTSYPTMIDYRYRAQQQSKSRSTVNLKWHMIEEDKVEKSDATFLMKKNVTNLPSFKVTSLSPLKSRALSPLSSSLSSRKFSYKMRMILQNELKSTRAKSRSRTPPPKRRRSIATKSSTNSLKDEFSKEIEVLLKSLHMDEECRMHS